LHNRKESVGFAMGILLTVLTGGLFIPVWVLIALFSNPWICQTCGTTWSKPRATQSCGQVQRFRVQGRDIATGFDTELLIDATDGSAAMRAARERGMKPVQADPI